MRKFKNAKIAILALVLAIVGARFVKKEDYSVSEVPSDKTSGLKDALEVLADVNDIAICRLTSADVVPLVKVTLSLIVQLVKL